MVLVPQSTSIESMYIICNVLLTHWRQMQRIRFFVSTQLQKNEIKEKKRGDAKC